MLYDLKITHYYYNFLKNFNILNFRFNKMIFQSSNMSLAAKKESENHLLLLKFHNIKSINLLVHNISFYIRLQNIFQTCYRHIRLIATHGVKRPKVQIKICNVLQKYQAPYIILTLTFGGLGDLKKPDNTVATTVLLLNPLIHRSQEGPLKFQERLIL